MNSVRISSSEQSSAAVHVAQISFFQDPQRRSAAELLVAWPTMAEVAEAAHGAGARVSVIQACSQTRTLTQQGVSYHFLAPDDAASRLSTSAPLRQLLRNLQPNVLHVHSLGAPKDVAALSELAPGIPILLQDHADGVPRFWRRGAWRAGFSKAAALSFSSRRLAEPFRKANLLGPAMKIFEIPESTTRFSPGDQAEARRLTGLHGDPCLLWVGHLNANKDPLTVLAGLSKAVERFPNLQLWCAYIAAPLLAQVERCIREDPRLRSRVHLLGPAGRERVQQLMRATDLFILGSHSESCGYALLEAMASGVAPIVPDIPSFRSLTGYGTVGRLWTRGESESLARALELLWSNPPADLRARVRAYFERELSFAALGRKLLYAYEQLLTGSG